MFEAFPDFLVGYDGLCFLDAFEGEFSEDEEVSSWVSVDLQSNKVILFYFIGHIYSPYLSEFYISIVLLI
jgi:hypothetical protein